MRKLLHVGLALFVLLANATFAAGLPINTAIRFEFTDCSSGGSVAQTLTAGDYWYRVTDADTFICLANSASTCASGGEKWPVGTVVLITIGPDQRSVSCRSSTSTGDAIFTSSR